MQKTEAAFSRECRFSLVDKGLGPDEPSAMKGRRYDGTERLNVDEVEWISTKLIRRDPKKKLDVKKVEKLRQAIEAGREIRPIVVSRMEDGTYRIVGDGRHRYEGHLAAGCEVIAARVV